MGGTYYTAVHLLRPPLGELSLPPSLSSLRPVVPSTDG